MTQKTFKRKSMDFLIGFIIFYGAVCLYLSIFQRGFIYFPSQMTYPMPADLGMPAPEEIFVDIDGQKMRSFYWSPPQNQSDVIVFFHGNAAAYEYWFGTKIGSFLNLGYGAVFVEYPGYGGNPSAPSEEGIMRNARSKLDYIINTKGIKPQNIILYGESLGTGVAVQMATEYDVKAVVLESAYTSIADVAKTIYWMFPVDLLLKDRFDSIKKIKDVRAPLMFMHGKLDATIQIHFAQGLFEEANEPKEFHELPLANHVNLYDHGAYDLLSDFLLRVSNSDQIPKE